MNVQKAKTILVYVKRNKGSTEIKLVYVFRENTPSSIFLLFTNCGRFEGTL